MAVFKTDNGGKALALKDVKLCTSASTWNTRLSQIGRFPGRVIICTFSLPDLEYIQKILDKRSKGVTIIAHERFSDRARILKNKYPDLQIICRSDVHAKIVLIEPCTVWLSSANFGKSGWFEHTIGIHSKEAFNFYLRAIKHYLHKKG